MNKKIILTAGGIALLIAAIIAAAVIKNSVMSHQGGSTADEAVSGADFDLICCERLAGYPATDYIYESGVAEVRYGDKGYIRKAYADTDSSGSDKDMDNTELGDEYTETTQQKIDRMDVTFKGRDGRVWLAFWNYNNFAYTICISEDIDGVSPEDMTDYVKTTR